MKRTGLITCILFATVLVLPLLAFTGLANAEQWNCYSNPFIDEITVVVTADTNNNTGVIKVAGTTQKARYSVEGFSRRWDFGDSKKFAFTIEPDGDATLYKIEGRNVEIPEMTLYCQEVK